MQAPYQPNAFSLPCEQALRACATDMRPFTYSFIPSIATFWLGGRLANVNTP